MAKTVVPSYTVTRNKERRAYVVTLAETGKRHYIRKVSNEGAYRWYARTRYFVTLRDAIIYCAHGVC